MVAGLRHERLASRDLDQLGHPRSSDHDRVDPLDRQDGRAHSAAGGHGLVRPGAEGYTSRAQLVGDSAPLSFTSDGFAHALHVAEDTVCVACVVQAGWFERHEPHVASRDRLESRLHVADRNGANVAEVLGEHNVWARSLESGFVDVVDGQGIFQRPPHVTINLVGELVDGDLGGRQNGLQLHAGREVALVADAHQLVNSAEHVNDFGRGGEEADDAHGDQRWIESTGIREGHA